MSDSVQVRVRMYRQGFGDCFLLTFSPKGQPKKVLAHVLIDCGVDYSTPKGSDMIRKVADQVMEDTKSKIDLLVATHEHWDHVSGFLRAKSVFEQLTIENTWLAWTEDPDDQFARSLKAERAMAITAAAVATRSLQENGALAGAERVSLEHLAESTAGILSFLGVDPLGAAKFSKATDQAMDYVLSRKRDHEYCKPGGSPWSLPSLPGVRFYVLGPPRDEKLLKRMDPSKTDPETYGMGAGFTETLSFVAGVQNLPALADAPPVPELLARTALRRLRDYPFPVPLQIPDTSPEARRSFSSSYFSNSEEWRRIDFDWLTGAADLALQLDNAINNTSLVLAIELPGTQEVLLFAADAQVGNWLSWQTCTWKVADSRGTTRTVSADELLRRTVLLKTAHHGSHNATLREKGLEMMSSNDLVAMISVDEGFARKVKGWDIPFGPLTRRLTEKTRGRLLRADRSWPTAKAQKPATLSAKEWEAFLDATEVNDLWIDYVVP